MTTQLATRETNALVDIIGGPTPADVVTIATAQANALMDIVERKKLYTVIGGKKYLEAEAWETILAFNNASPVTKSLTPIMEGDQMIGYTAQVDIVKNGEVLSSGVMPCGFDDFPCQGKSGMAKHKAAMSAAQTWALSKAARMKYAYVVVLANYEPTPADEMKTAAVDKASPYFCPEHEIVWFKRGNMKNYAHPLDGGGWCNMPKTASAPAAQPAQSAAPTAAPSDADMLREWKMSIAEGFVVLGISVPGDQQKWVQTNCPLVPTGSRDWKPADWETVSNTMSNYLAGLAQEGATHGTA